MFRENFRWSFRWVFQHIKFKELVPLGTFNEVKDSSSGSSTDCLNNDFTLKKKNELITILMEIKTLVVIFVVILVDVSFPIRGKTLNI